MYQSWFRLNADSDWIILDEITKYIGATSDLSRPQCRMLLREGIPQKWSKKYVLGILASKCLHTYIIHNIYIYIVLVLQLYVYSVTVCILPWKLHCHRQLASSQASGYENRPWPQVYSLPSQGCRFREWWESFHAPSSFLRWGSHFPIIGIICFIVLWWSIRWDG